MANWLTKINPFKRTPNMQLRRFQAAQIDRFTQRWLTTTQDINQELKSDLDKLRERARDAVKNAADAKKFVNMCVENIVGPNGFTLQVKATENNTTDSLGNAAVELAFSQWAETADITGKLSFAEICKSMVRCLPSDGEYLVRIVRGKDAGNVFDFALQLLDPARIDTKLNRQASGNVNAIIMGIEVDNYLRPVNYYLRNTLPGAIPTSVTLHDIVPASDILHNFVVEHPEQVRGVPWLAAGLLDMHHMSEFLKSAMLAARKSANTLGFIVNVEGSKEDADAEINISVPGEYDTLPPGYDVRNLDSKYPDAMIGDFCKIYDRKIANAFNVSYASFSNDLSDVNFSSIRTGVLAERDQWMNKQNWFMRDLLRIYREWLQMALLKGKVLLPNGSALPARVYDKFSVHMWQGRRWQWVDPLKDIQYAREAVKSGVLSPQAVAAQNGMDVEDVLDDIQRFETMLSSKKITLVDYEIKNQQSAPAQANGGN